MQEIPAPSASPLGPWMQIEIATPTGAFRFPPVAYGWGSVKVSVVSKARNEKQKAAGRAKAKTKKTGPEPLELSIELKFARRVWDDADGFPGVQKMLNAIDPNGDAGGGPFDFSYGDFTRRGGKSIDVDEVGAVDWQGELGTVSIKAKEWVAEPPKTGTKDPNKSSELEPGDTYFNARGALPEGETVTIARKGIAGAFGTVARKIAERGFDGPNKPTAAP